MYMVSLLNKEKNKKYFKKTIRKLSRKNKNTRKKKKTNVTSKRRYLKNHTHKRYKKKYKKGGSHKVCPICLRDITTNNVTTNCSHDFHKDCLKQWCSTKTSINEIPCPLCRKNIKNTCEKIKESDDTEIFNYTDIAGADDERLEMSKKKVHEFVNKDNFDVNVKDPRPDRKEMPILYVLTRNADFFYDSINILLTKKTEKDINESIDEDLISLLTVNYQNNDKIKELFKKKNKINTKKKKLFTVWW